MSFGGDMTDRPLWRPDPLRVANSGLAAFERWLVQHEGVRFASYGELHAWSVAEPATFWRAVWDFCAVVGEPGARTVEGLDQMPGAQWFPEARLNFARNLLGQIDESPALVFRGEQGMVRRSSRAELHAQVAQCAAAMRAAGLQVGDRVAAYMPNIPETVIVMLAAASLGAVFSSASPDFGVQGVVDRFGQIAPRLLFVTDGVRYADKTLDSLARVAEIAVLLPTVERVVVVPYVGQKAALDTIRGGMCWTDFLAPFAEVHTIDYAELPFSHPLFILYSSGTTGVPKCIVHGAGGTLLQHLKEHRLHGDIRPGDRVFYFTTCGWMMWNWLVSALASRATVLLFDGSPFAGHGRVLWDYAAGEGCTHFGTSAKYLDGCAKLGLAPMHEQDLAALRMIFSTGSPLSHEGFEYVYTQVKRDVCLSSISGGTDIISCFVLGNPGLPVWRGEIQCKGLGMAVEVFDEQGQPLHAGKGELVCTRPFPSMPLYFWGDTDGHRYHNAYFGRFPGVWCHGDWCEETEHGGLIIHGRSDATLNPGGVRIGTAEIYRQVEKLPEVLESIVIGQNWDNDVRTVLFVRLREDAVLDEALVQRIKQVIRDNASPRHVPARIVQVPDIPRTKSGKIVELAVRAAVHGEPVHNVEALANPEALAHFKARPELSQ